MSVAISTLRGVEMASGFVISDLVAELVWHPQIHQIYTEVYGTERIWVHPDRVNMKPPKHPDYPEWDHKG